MTLADNDRSTTDDGAPAEPRSPLLRMFGSKPDETILTWLFRGLLVATAIILGIDLAQMRAEPERGGTPTVPGASPSIIPFLPSTRGTPTPHPVLASPEDLRAPVRFELISGNRLVLQGAIEVGVAERFAEEVDKRGDYIDTVILNSPGGSVNDALAISRIIRESGISTFVESGGYCASSCPLILAGGVDRTVATDASIGVHQVASAGVVPMSGEDGMENAQRVSAEIQRHLVDMGVDPRVWLHAMETPHEDLHYFTPEDMMSLHLATRLIASNR